MNVLCCCALQRNPRVHGPRGAAEGHSLRQQCWLVLPGLHALQAAEGVSGAPALPLGAWGPLWVSLGTAGHPVSQIVWNDSSVLTHVPIKTKPGSFFQALHPAVATGVGHEEGRSSICSLNCCWQQFTPLLAAGSVIKCCDVAPWRALSSPVKSWASC